MNANKADAYNTASTYSFTLHAKEKSIVVSDSEPTVMPIGIQPFGITSLSLPEGGDMVVVANYLAPAQHIGTVVVHGGTLTRRFSRISGAESGVIWCRGGIPGFDEVAQANRCWTAMLAPRNKVWVGRGDPEFFVLEPPRSETGRWNIVSRVQLPRQEVGKPLRFVASATLCSENRLVTVEHDGNYYCECVFYALDVVEDRVMRTGEQRRFPLGKFRYGIALAEYRGGVQPVTVTPYHSLYSAGIYCGEERIVGCPYADGICPLSNGGALLTQRGMESHEADSLEAPGALIYVPSALFPAGFKWVR